MFKKPFLLFSLLFQVFGHAQKLPSENPAGILIKGSVIDKETLQYMASRICYYNSSK